MAHGGKRLGAGRPVGTTRNRQEAIATFARGIVEDPIVQELLRTQAREGSLSVPMFQMLFHYAYGKPQEASRDDQVFMEDLLAVVLKHAGTHEARQEIRAVLEAHEFGAARLSAVA